MTRRHGELDPIPSASPAALPAGGPTGGAYLQRLQPRAPRERDNGRSLLQAADKPRERDDGEGRKVMKTLGNRILPQRQREVSALLLPPRYKVERS